MSLSSGTRLGPYEIVSPLGRGGMGEVWKALDTRLDRIVAIKKLDGGHSEGFESEARTIAALNHPNICTLYDIGPDFLVMEFIDGAPLSGPMTLEDSLSFGQQIAAALEAAHDRGILHRDLKPANVLVSGRTAKLLDFGIAQRTGPGDADVTQPRFHLVTGTAGYMSPEQAQGQALDSRSDIFSFGIVLYELVSGARPFKGESVVEVVSALLRDDPAPLQTDERLAQIITRCLQKRPEERFQRMSDVREALSAVIAGRPDARPSIAVLPFADLSPGRDHEYFSDGLADEIINVLAQIPGLKVIARTSSFAFKGQHTDIRRVAEMLGVAAVLEGSVRKAGNRIRVIAQLITAKDGSHLWSERYDRNLEDIFEVQDQIAEAIGSALRATLEKETSRGRKYIPSIAAYDAYLKARHHQWRLTPESMALTRGYLESAIALDPRFAMAHFRLSGYYFGLTMMGILPGREAAPIIRAGLQRALDLDPSLAEAHALLGILAAVHDFDWSEADRCFAAARAREPIPSEVRGMHAVFLHARGSSPEAVEQLRPALSEDPLSVILHHQMGVCLLAGGRPLEARAQFSEALRLEPTFAISQALRAASYLAEGQISQALADAEQTHTMNSNDPASVGLLAGLLDLSGDKTRAMALLKDLQASGRYGTSMARAIHAMISGDLEGAAAAVEQALLERYFPALVFMRLPFGDALRASAHWPKIVTMMNLPTV